ncbi:hypothetical protein PISMIDRAFT_689488, partial [Pisolithus microcarpus 441]
MSSEESSIENEIEEVLRVKNMEWRRCVNRELELVDFQSSRAPVKGLPMALYDSAWITGLSQHQMEGLQVSNQAFPWIKIAI